MQPPGSVLIGISGKVGLYAFFALLGTLFELPVSAAFTNGGFEIGTPVQPPSGWTVTVYSNLTGITFQNPQTLAGLNLRAGGTNHLTIMISSAAGPFSQPDPTLGTSASLRWPRYGDNCAIINKVGRSYSANGLSQTGTLSAQDFDPVDGQIHVRFVIAPVLEDPGHVPSQQPYYYFQLENVTSNTVLYEDLGVLSDATIPWKTYLTTTTTNRYTDWQLVDIQPGAGVNIGDQVQLLLIASGCSLAAHFGELYVDGVGTQINGISVEASAPATVFAGNSLAYTLAYRNGGASSESGVQMTFTTPANTTFLSATTPAGFTMTAPPVGTAGTLTATAISPVAAGASGTFTVTVNVSSAATGMVTARNYGILSTQERELLGPKVATSIIHLYPIVLGQPVISASNIFSCGFTNSPGLSFTLLGASSLSTPLNQWTPVGGIVESPPGTYTIADSATNAARFYRVAAAP